MSTPGLKHTISVQVTNALGKPVKGVELSVHINGKHVQTIRKNTEKPVRIKVSPPDASVEITAKAPELPPQRKTLTVHASECNFVIKGAGTPIVLIVCARDCEQSAVLATCDSYSDPFSLPNDNNIYREGVYVRKRDGQIRKVLIVTGGMHNLNANSVTVQALSSFADLEHILMVGIAGGCPNDQKPAEHVRLGDIVVVDYRGILEYDHVKMTQKGSKPRSHPQEPSARMLQAATQLDSGAALGKRPWEDLIKKGTKKYQAAVRPADKFDVLHAGAEPVAHPDDPDRRRGLPRVHRGAIGSADVLQKNPRIRDNLRDKWDIRAIEMEGSGVQHAAWMKGKDVIVVRGICDYCDQYKNDQWQPYASLVAAAYARSMIEVLPDEWFP